MKRIFSIFVATLLLSTTLLAEENVATLGSQGYTKANFAQAISDWATNGGELTLNEDCEYNATATVTISKNATLNLNGKTLTWKVTKDVNAITIAEGGNLTILGDAANKGIMSFQFKYAVPTSAYNRGSIYQKAGICAITNATIDCNVETTGTKTTVLTIANVYSEGGELSFKNATINMRGRCVYGVYLNENSLKTLFAGLTIEYISTENQALSYDPKFYGIWSKAQILELDNKANVQIDLSDAPVKYKYGTQEREPYQCALYFDKGQLTLPVAAHISAGLYKTNTTLKNSFAVSYKGTSNPSNSNSSEYCKVNIEGGVFVGAKAVSTLYSKSSSNNGSYISGGLFSVEPKAASIKEGYKVSQITAEGEYKGYYEVKPLSRVVLSIDGQAYTEAEGWAKCSTTGGTYTAVTLLEDVDYTIPAGVYVSLEKEDALSVATITNNGNLKITEGSWNNTFDNKGTFNIEGGSFGDNFKLTGTAVVTGGTFTAKAKEQIKDYIATGYEAIAQADGTYRIVKSENIVAEVNGTKYTDLESALIASSANYPAILLKDYTKTSQINPNVETKQAMFLDMNGKTLTLDKEGADGMFVINNVDLTILGEGTIRSNAATIFKVKGTAAENSQNYSSLTIGEKIVIENTYAKGYGVAVDDVNRWYGVTVNFNGTYKGASAFYINGTYIGISDNMPTFNIGKDAKFECSDMIGYAGGYGIWNYEGTATVGNCGFEMRAGELTMNGGSIVSTATKPADDQFNGNGSTSQACGIAVCQHSTKLPINVVVNDGYIKAYTPLYQSNPQNNETDMKQINLTVNGGKFFSTSKNIVYSLNKRIFLNGGVYNMNPSAYAAEGKVVVANTNEATKDMYPYTIGDVKSGVTFQTAGEWSNAANWSATATAETPVTIAANVTIGENVKAEAYGITVAEGKTITIQKGGMLVVGKQGVAGITSADQLVIEDGGYLLISPAATANNQPLTTVVRTMNTQKKADGTYEEDDSPYVRYYMGIPTVGQPAVSSNEVLYARDWDAATGWKDATEFKTMFKGYGITSEKLNEQASFSGQLIGNTDASLVMPRKGFHFFANGWMAPMDMYEVLNQLDQLKNNGSVEAAVTVCVAEGQYQDLNRKQLYQYPEWEQVAPLNTYFLHANKATTINVNYEKAVWNVQLAKKSAAQKHVAEEDNNAVRIKLMAANNRQDNVYIYDGEEFHSTKMMNTGSNVNIFVEKDENNYSTFASEDLEGTVIGIQTNSQTNYSLTFDFVKGKTLYIKDLQTSVVTAMTEGNVYNFTATPKETSRRFMVTYNTPTLLDNTVVNTAAKGVYSITGQYLGDCSVLETLPQGVYVVDGQKYCK